MKKFKKVIEWKINAEESLSKAPAVSSLCSVECLKSKLLCNICQLTCNLQTFLKFLLQKSEHLLAFLLHANCILVVSFYFISNRVCPVALTIISIMLHTALFEDLTDRILSFNDFALPACITTSPYNRFLVIWDTFLPVFTRRNVEMRKRQGNSQFIKELQQIPKVLDFLPQCFKVVLKPIHQILQLGEIKSFDQMFDEAWNIDARVLHHLEDSPDHLNLAWLRIHHEHGIDVSTIKVCICLIWRDVPSARRKISWRREISRRRETCLTSREDYQREKENGKLHR